MENKTQHGVGPTLQEGMKVISIKAKRLEGEAERTNVCIYKKCEEKNKNENSFLHILAPSLHNDVRRKPKFFTIGPTA